MKKKAQTWHLKGVLGLVAVFVAGLFVSGAFGGVSPLGQTSSGDTGTGTSSASSGDTGTTSSSSSTVPYIVTFTQGTSADDQTSEIAAAGATDDGAIAPLSMHSIDVPADSEAADVVALQANSNVADVEKDRSRETDAAPNDPGYADQWNLPMIGWDQIYGSTNPLGSSTIAVLDTGVSGSTGDLNLGAGWSAFGTDPTNDPNGHGTAVASIAAATADNGIGIAGVDFANPTIEPVQVLDANGLGQDSDIIQGVVWAADHGANVILMSFSNPGFSQALQDAVNYAWGKGAVVVAATGNDGSDSPTYPAGDADVMGVSGTDQSDQPWADSNTGADTFLASPATNIPADATDGSETSITGTSASAAMVAGAAGLLLANDPLATNAIVDGRLARNADPVGATDQTGNGRLDLARAVADTSTDPVTPLGAPGGGPFVGPYVAAASGFDVNVTPTTVGGGTTNNFTFTFTAANGSVGTSASLTIPSGWTTPQSGAGAGQVTVTTGSCTSASLSSIVGNVINISENCGNNKTFTVTYNDATSPLTAQTYTFTATPINNTSPTVTVTAATPDATQSTLTPVTSSITANGTATQVLTVQAKTSGGVNLTTGGATVTITKFSGSGSISGVTDNHNGTYTATVTAPTATGSGVFVATLGGNPVKSGTANQTQATVNYVAGPATKLVITGSATQTAGTSQNLTITAKDANGNTATSYTGDKSLTFSGANTISSFHPTVTDKTGSAVAFGTAETITFTNGVATVSGSSNGTMTLFKAESATIAATDGSINTGGGGTLAVTVSPAALDHLTLSPSSSTITAGNSQSYTAEGFDQFGNDRGDVTSATTFSISPNGAGTGASCAGASCTATKAGSYTVTGTDSGKTGAASLTVNAASAVSFTLSAASTTPTAGAGDQLSVTAKDQFGNVASGYTGDHVLTFSGANPAPDGTQPTVNDKNGGAINFGSSTTITFNAGVASQASNALLMTLFRAGIPATISVTDGSLSSNGVTVNVSSGTAASLEVFNFGVVNATAGDSFQVDIRAKDQWGNVASSYTGDKSLTFSGPGVSPNGTQPTVTDKNGNPVNLGTATTITFSNGQSLASGSNNGLMTLYKAETSHIQVTDGTLASGTGPVANIIPAALDHISIAPHTASIVAGHSQAYTSEEFDQYGNDRGDGTGSTSFSISPTGAGTGASCTGASCTATKTGSYVVTGNDSGKTDTGSLSVTPDAATHLHLDQQPTNTVAGQSISPAVSVDILDQFNNIVTTDNSTQITVAIGTNPGSGTLSGTLTQPAASGVATFGDLSIDKAGTGYTLTSTSSPSLTGDTSSTFNITHAGAAKLDFSAEPNSTYTADDTIHVEVAIEDTFGNLVNDGPDAGDNVSVALGGPSATLFGTLTQPASGGIASFDDLQVHKVGLGYLLHATSGSLTGKDSSMFDITPGAATHLKFDQQPTSTVAGQTISPAVSVDILDQYQNLVTGDGSTQVSLAIGNNPSAGTLSGTTSQQAAAGVATFGDLSIDHHGSGYTLGATSTPTLTGDTSSAFDITARSTSTSVSCSPDPVDAGAATSCTATVTDTSGAGASTPQGNVNFSSDGSGSFSPAASCTLSGGSCSVSYMPDAADDPGTHNIGATYTGSNVHAGSTATAFPLNITTHATLTITKDASPSTVIAGQNVTYTLTVTNTGPSDARNVSVSDSLDTQLTDASYTVDGGPSNTWTGSASVGRLTPGSDSTVVITATVKPNTDPGYDLQNTATTSSPTDANSPETSNTTDQTVATQANLSIAKTDGVTSVLAGGPGGMYAITVTNTGPSDARDVSVSDIWPSGFTRGTVSPSQGSCDTVSDPANFACALGTVPAGGSVTITAAYSVPSSTLGDQTNTSSVSTSTTNTSANTTASDTDSVATEADLSIINNAPTDVTAGTPISYTLNVHNGGESDARNVMVSDPLTPGTDYTNATYSIDGIAQGSYLGSASLGDVTAGADHTVVITATVASFVPDGTTLNNTANVSSDTFDQSTGNNTSTQSTAVHAVADVADLKVSDANPVVAGDKVDYTITVSNTNGPSDAQNVSLADTLDPELSNPKYCIGSSCDPSSGSDFSSPLALGTIAAGDSVVVHLEADLSPSDLNPTLSNTATVSSTTQDPDPNNNTSTATVNVTTEADLSITKSGPSDDVAGEGIEYILTVTNDGPSDAQHVSIDDTLPLSIDGATYSVSSGNNSSGSYSSPLDIGTIQAHSSATVTIDGTINHAVADGTVLKNTASVSSATPDPVDNNTSNEVDTTVHAIANVSISKDGDNTVVAGTPIHYTINVTNPGPSDAQNVVVHDTLPSGTSNATYSVDGGGTSSWSGSTSFSALAAGDSHEITITADTSPSLGNGSDLANTATVTSDTTNQTGTTSATKHTAVQTSADLSITKTGPSATIAGDPSGFDYAFTVHNGGPSDNTGGFTISDTLPSDLTYVSASSPDCSAVGQDVTCTHGDLAFGAPDVVYAIHVTLASSAEGTLSNNADLASNGTTDPAGNNSSTWATTINKDVHLHVVKAFQSQTVTAGGDTQTFTLDVSNSGFSDADNLQVLDSVDPRLSVTNVDGGGLDCSGSTLGSPATISCTAAHLVSSGDKTITVTYKVDTTTEAGTISNSATASSNEDTTTSNTASVDIVKDVRLDVTKHFNDATVTAGDLAGSSFTITAKNVGVSRGDNLAIVDNVPSDLIVTNVSGSAGLNCGGSGGQLVSCTEGFIASGEQQSVTVDYRVDTNTDAETVANTATASTDETSQNATDSVDVVENVDLAISKTFDSSTVTAGGASQTFTITVQNNGLSRADNVTLDDSVDSRLQVTGLSGSTFSCGSPSQTIHCTLAHLASNGTATLVVTYNVDTNTEADPSVSNTAFAAADEETIPVSATDTVAIVKDVQLAVTKTFADHTVTSGGSASSFQIDVTNNGVSRADNVVLTDNVNNKLVVDSIDAGNYTCNSGQNISCSLGHLAASDTQSITVHYHVNPDTAAGSVGNTGSATSDEVTTPQTASDSVQIVKDVQLSASKTFASQTVVAGDPAGSSFTLSVTNNGVSTADNIHLTDAVPSDLIVDSATPNGAFNCNTSAAQNVDCSLGTLANGQTETVTVAYHVSANTEAETLTNTGHVSSDENTAGVDSNQAQVQVVKDVHLQVTKSFAPSTVDAGTSGNTFTITVENTGLSRADNLEVTDSVDSRLNVTNVSGTGASCGSPSQSIDCTAAHLDPNATATITGTYSVASGTAATAAGSPVTNTAHASTDETSADSNTATVAITTHADVADLKVQTGSNIAGNTITYTSTVTNSGPSDAPNVTFTDNLDPHLLSAQYCTTSGASCSPSTGWPNSGSISLGTLTANQSVTVVISAQIDPSTPQGYDLSNTSSANSSGATDPTPGNNDSTVDTTVDTLADLTLAKSGPPSVVAGAGFDYTLTVTNGGPSDNTGGFSVVDTLPSGVTFDSSPDGCIDSGSATVTCSNSTGLVHGGTQTFDIHVLASQTLETGDTLHNTATVSSNGTANPPNGDTATFDTTVTKDVKLAITKQFTDPQVTAGGAGSSFTINVTNNGVSQADNVEVKDTVDSRLIVDGASGDFSCGSPSQSLDCTLGHIAAGQTKSITVTYHVAHDTQPATVSNSASVTTSDEPSEIDSSPASVQVVTSADLTLAKSAPGSVVAGDPGGFDYTLTVSNGGPSDNTGGFTVVDTLPAGVSFVSSPDNCAPSGGNTVTCTNPSGLANGGTQTFHLHVLASQTLESTDTLHNTATVSSNGTTNPPNGDSASADSAVTENVNLTISKQFTSPTVVAGGAGSSFTINVGDTGFTDADNVVVTDKVDSRLVIDSITGPFSCTQTAEVGNTLVSCSLATLDSNAPKTITVNYHVGAATPPAAAVNNSASAQSDEETTPVTNSASVQIVAQADLAITKTDGTNTVTPGTSTTYTIVVSNLGPSNVTGASVVDNIPAGVSSWSWTSTNGGGASGNSPSGTANINDSVNMPAGSTLTYTVIANVSPSATGTLTNVATVAAPSNITETNGTNNTATDSDTLTPNANLAVTKTGPASATAGNNVTYSITVKNNGPSNNAGFSLSDTLPSGESFVSATPADCTNASGTVTCVSSGLANGNTVTWQITANVASSFTGSSITNTASIAPGNNTTPDGTPGDNTSQWTTNINQSADLAITKTGPSTAQAGTPFSYTIVVNDAGQSAARNVQVTDTLPASFTNASYTVDGGSVTAYSSPISLGTMDASGASSTHTIVITGTPTLATTITNQANVTSTTSDPSASNNTSAVVSTNVSAGPAAKLSFSQQPTDTAAEATINPSTGVVVQATDQYGNPTNTAGESIGIGITTGTGTTGATLSGTLARPTNGSGQAVFNDLSIDLAGAMYQLTATDSGSGGYPSVDSTAFNITPGTLLSQVATADANWQNNIDGADVLFGPAPNTNTQSLKNTNPGSFHWQLTLQNETGLQLHDPGVAINTKNGGKVEVWLTIPQLPSSVGTNVPAYATQYQNASASAFVTQGPNAINIRPGAGGPPAGPPAPVGPPGPGGGGPNMQFKVAYIVGGSGAPTDCSQAGSAFDSNGNVQGQWTAGEPADGTNVKCIYVSGLNIPPHGKANMDVNLQTVLASKGNTGWASNAQNLFRAGFPFRSVTTITLDSNFGLMCKPPNSTNCSDPHGFNAAYGNKQYSGAQALGLVFAGKQVTAIGGYAFDQNALGIQGANVLLFNSQADAMAANCNVADPRVVGRMTTQSDGFYFIDNTGQNPGLTDPNNLPFNVAYYVAVCNVPGVPPVNWPARYMNAGPNGAPGPKLGNKQFDEEDFFISPTTSVVFTKQPMNTSSRNAFAVSAQLQDAFGQPVPNDTTTPITLTANMNNGQMACTPSNPQTQTGGVASFSCKISVVANNYQLTASAPSLKSSNSQFFNITK